MSIILSLVITFTIAVAGQTVPGRAFDRLITIWLGHEDFNSSVNNAVINNLSSQGILLDEYYSLTHPSQPNYVGSIGGDYFGLDHDNFTRIPRNVSTIVDLLDTKNIDWRGYFEDSPGPGYMGPENVRSDGKTDYVRKHNPFVQYDSINFNGTRLSRLLSFRDFDHELKANSLPQYIHISPNVLNDGHETTSLFALNWTDFFLGPLLKNTELMNRTLILLTYDESKTPNQPNRVTSLLLGGAIPENLRNTTDSTLYTHYSIISTVENNWDLPCLGRYDVGANVFELVASQTNYSNIPSPNLSLVNNSFSYHGFLNSDPAKHLPMPPPNLNLTGAGGQGVVKVVMDFWKDTAKNDTPYDGSGRLFDGGDGTNNQQAPQYQAQDSNIRGLKKGAAAKFNNKKSLAARKNNLNSEGLCFWVIFGLSTGLTAVFSFIV
ncbi:BgTH12-00479 [Blumeria graminis f. sp. triticale]|uniref:BgTH12-00479 n=1 Tax=Blumeria graminis f. sp. triticale TaxID=1689686 RepID=A0A9W4GIJ9_BLUGR|nr:BgTH12-00479 [Blumeria graminis f. sp. triticale]